MHKQQEYKQAVGTLITRRNPFTQGLRLLFLSGALLACGASRAQEAASETTTLAVESPMTGHLLQTTLGLLFVLALLMALVWLLKRMGIGNQKRRGGFYKVLATSALGPREKIVLVEIGDTWLVLGMTSNGINTLHSMPAGSIELDGLQSPAVNFAKMLERMKTGKVKP
ncbi:MAG: flagellar biosynthetic protein FliO [Gammaproteobacteria bacterium]|nr:flagellar biosynthetic protein FliO [Gammaproteobacteria bacterium]MBU0848321.1 flagellar biosynthetic protein FliO [Gammaproteobacteria bacterium]MBU1267014.1 flagellar biosynthetic protein FliO [Gammaproteobacteria bacterium]MBU1529545.1 flagellar biosynthetic protein FliO [Gammaproteobacteria bacterium]MBU1781126.1 flagellar biosynthetic protein FliO [Gammaproteobacteria bacterium]